MIIGDLKLKRGLPAEHGKLDYRAVLYSLQEYISSASERQYVALPYADYKRRGWDVGLLF
jgi:hypothetical protein